MTLRVLPRQLRAPSRLPAAFIPAVMLFLLLCSTVQAKAPPASGVDLRWRDRVERISAGTDTAARAAAITARLDQMGLPWHDDTFEHEGNRGRNLLVDLGGPDDAPLLLIGAHYDRVEVGHGATDNASGVAAVLELAQVLKARPLARHRVMLAFWDLEEHGLLGSRAWVAAPGRQAPALYVNFDVFGWGDTLWMMAPEGNAVLVDALRAASTREHVGFSPGVQYPPTDHLAFQRAGWPAVSFSLVGGDEIDGILQVFSGNKPATPPKVMQVIHSAGDDASQLDPRNIAPALRTVEAGLRAWDVAAPPR